MDELTVYTPGMLMLEEASVMESKISDHNPLTHRGVMSFNMMMRGRYNAEKRRYNTGFGLDEDQATYQSRIKEVVRLLAEAAHIDSSLYAIGLVEAPITPEDIALFITEATKYPSLARFQASLVPASFSTMGVVTLIDGDRFAVEAQEIDYTGLPSSLENRVQKFVLTEKGKSAHRFQLCNLHLPFDLAKGKGQAILQMLTQNLLEGELPSVVMGDFNMDPREMDLHLDDVARHVVAENNILAVTDQKSGRVIGTKPDTVDGILACKADALPHCPSIKINLMAYAFNQMMRLMELPKQEKCPVARSSLSFFQTRQKEACLLMDDYAIA